MSDFKVEYNGVDIYDEVSVTACTHDMHAWSAIDSLRITFGNVDNYWDGWSPQIGDTVCVSDEAASTGIMYVAAISQRAANVDMVAYPVPPSIRDAKTRSWEKVTLSKLIKSIAAEHGLTVEMYGVSDHLYKYIQQRNMSDLDFLAQRLTLEGVSLTAFDGKLIAFGGTWAEKQDALGEIEVLTGDDFEFSDCAAEEYEQCTVTDGRTSATFKCGSGRAMKRSLALTISDKVEAQRFAKGLLREANRECYCMIIRSDSMLRDLAPGSVINLTAEPAPSWDGVCIVAHLRHDYFNSRSKIWLTKPLEDY